MYVFDRIRDAVLLLRRFPQLLILPAVVWLADLTGQLWIPSGTPTDVILARMPAFALSSGAMVLVTAFLQAGQVSILLNVLAERSPAWAEYWAATRRFGLRLVGLTLLFGVLLILGSIFTAPLLSALGWVGAALLAVCSSAALIIYVLAMLLLIRDNLTAGDALGAAWRFAWGYRSQVSTQFLAIFLCSAALQIVMSLLKSVPGVAAIGNLASNFFTGAVAYVVFADLIRTYPVPPRGEAPPSPF